MAADLGRALALAFVLAPPGAGAAALALTPQVENPRPFGYTVGDVLQQRIVLVAPRPLALAEDALPRPGRSGAWFERLAPRVRSHPAEGGSVYEVTLGYQLINAPEALTTLSLPAVTLRLRGAGQEAEASVGEWPVTAAPLTPQTVLARAGLEETRPDQPPLPVDASGPAIRLVAWLAALTLVAAWLLLERYGVPFLSHSRRPFASAYRRLRRLAGGADDPAAYREALRTLHRAFDRSAGRSVFAEQIDRFLADFPVYGALREDIARFYRASRAEFFGQGGERLTTGWLADLCLRCRRLEREAAR